MNFIIVIYAFIDFLRMQTFHVSDEYLAESKAETDAYNKKLEKMIDSIMAGLRKFNFSDDLIKEFRERYSYCVFCRCYYELSFCLSYNIMSHEMVDFVRRVIQDFTKEREPVDMLMFDIALHFSVMNSELKKSFDVKFSTISNRFSEIEKISNDDASKLKSDIREFYGQIMKAIQIR